MKMKLAYPHLPPIEIEMQVQECAQLLLALQTHGQALPVATAPVNAESKVDKPAAEGQALREDIRETHGATKTPVDREAARKHQQPVAEQPKSDAAQESARPYNGKVNRRHRVLQIFQDFNELGEDALSIPQITAAFSERFPDDDASNLDQVVRDMMNKTQQIERVKRGYYALKA